MRNDAMPLAAATGMAGPMPCTRGGHGARMQPQRDFPPTIW